MTARLVLTFIASPTLTPCFARTTTGQTAGTGWCPRLPPPSDGIGTSPRGNKKSRLSSRERSKAKPPPGAGRWPTEDGSQVGGERELNQTTAEGIITIPMLRSGVGSMKNA
jgi:hypothetical protein